MRRSIRILVILVIIGAAGLWITRPQTIDADAFASLTPDVENGALVLAAMGCASCHRAPDTEDGLVLAGGYAMPTDFGTFYAPNISSDPTHGIGTWSNLDIANAVLKGTSPDGQHYYPAFPYASYVAADLQDLADLAAYLRTLPADQTPNKPHDVGFPFNIRETLGGWKMLSVRSGDIVTTDLTPEETRGQYLVETLGHCGECHTPRNIIGGLDFNQWLAGAPSPSGKGRVPDIRPDTLQWSETDIAEYLKSGFTPEFDTAGGDMVDVISGTSQLPQSDRDAIAAYLVALPNNPQ